MKLLTIEQTSWLTRRAHRLKRREIQSKLKAKAKRRAIFALSGERVTVFRSSGVGHAYASGRIEMPEVFCLDQNVAETIKFLSELREVVLTNALAKPPRRKTQHGLEDIGTYYDFKTINQISPTAALVLAAIFDRQKSIAGHRLMTVDEHLWSPNVLNVLKSLGFHQLLQLRPDRRPQKKDKDVRTLEFVSGENADGPSAGKVQSALVKLLPETDREKLLDVEPYSGMLEAILNSYSWAYPPEFQWDYPPLKRWWMTGSVNLVERSVTVAVYDQGVSIPVSLPGWKHWPELLKRAKKLADRARIELPVDHFSNDGVAIALAMKIAKSATNLPQHGKGLQSMVEVAERAKDGRLRIISRNGEYVWEKGKRPFTKTHACPIGGTLIEWNLKL